MITVYQSDGTTVTPLADGKLYEFLSGGTVGVILGCQVTSLGGLQLQIASGWILIKGRIIAIQQETISVTPSTSGAVNGRLLLHLDVSSDDAPGTWVTQAQTPLPELVQEDINGSGTIFEMPLATYQVDQLQVTDLQTVSPLALGPVSHLYTATYTIDGWTASDGESTANGYPWAQTVQAVPRDPFAPTVTKNSQFEPSWGSPKTAVAETNEILKEALNIIADGVTTTGAGTVTTLVKEKPTTDIPVVWELRTEV